MLVRTAKTLRVPWSGMMAALALGLASPATGQSSPPVSAAQFDPSDVYFQGYLTSRTAEQLEQGGDFIGALEKFRKAEELFTAVRKYYPDWKPEMVGRRCEKTTGAIAAVQPKAEEQFVRNRNAVAELEGGVKQGGKWIDPARDVVPLTPGILEVDPLATRRLEEAETEVKRLRDLAARANSQATPDVRNSRDASRVEDISRQRDALRADLRAAENNVKSLRARLAVSPVETELKTLNERIGKLEQEREAMAMALTQSRSAHTEAMSRIATLEMDLKLSRQKVADLNRDLKAERGVANSVVAGQRRQLDALEKELQKKDTELAAANQRIAGLSTS
jgi:predicted  nucleic acid-binding Zn-ribbon protein